MWDIYVQYTRNKSKKKKKVFQTEYIIEFIKVDEQNKLHTSFAN